MDEFDDMPFFHAPVIEDGLFPSSGFAPLYDENILDNGSNGHEWGDSNEGSRFSMYDDGKNMPFNMNPMMSVNSMMSPGNMNMSPGNMNMSPGNMNINPSNMNIVSNKDDIIFEGNRDGINPYHDFSIDGSVTPKFSPPSTSQSTLLSPSSSLPMSQDVNETKSKKRPRKKKKNMEELPSPNGLTNIEDVQNILVTLDSEVFDEYIGQVTKFRERGLSNEETNVVKDIRRRIKNRESARKCRQNRKNKMGTLEEKIKALVDETHQLQEDIAGYKKENQCLEEEVQFLQNIIYNNPIFSTVFQEYSNAPPEKRLDILKNALSSQSFFLLAVMFSFGIVFNVDSNGNAIPLLNRGFFRDYKDDGTRSNPSGDLIKEKITVN